MKAIFTKYHGPTNTKGSRISASDSDGNRVVVSSEIGGDILLTANGHEAIHRRAAEALCSKMNWTGKLAGGALKNGYVFVFVEPVTYKAMPDQERIDTLAAHFVEDSELLLGLSSAITEAVKRYVARDQAKREANQ